MPEVEEKVYRLEAVLEEFIKNVGIEFNKLYNTQMRTEMELQEFRRRIEEGRQVFEERLEKERRAFEERLERDRQRSREEMKAFEERLEKERRAFEERLERDRQRSQEEMKAFDERLEKEKKAFEERLEKERRDFEERLERDRKAFEERLEKDRQRSQEDMKAFEERLERDRKAFEEKLQKDTEKWEKEFKAWRAEMNRKWGEVTNKLGTFAEDMVAPNIKGIAKQYFGCEDFDFFAVRIKKRHSIDRAKRREFDCIAVCDEIVILNETKSTPRIEYINDFIAVLKEFYDYFPEYKGKKLIPIFASMYLSDDLVRYLTKNGIYAMAMKEDTMDLLNYEEVRITQG